MRTDLAELLRLSRVNAAFQADVILVKTEGETKIAKHNRKRPETKLPRFYAVQSLELEEGLITMIVTPLEQGFDGKDKIRNKTNNEEMPSL